MDAASKEKLLETLPLGHLGTPADVAKAVAFLCFDAPYMQVRRREKERV